MESQEPVPPSGTAEPQFYRFHLTVSGSRQRVWQGLRAWLELGLLTPEEFHSLVERYHLQPPAEDGAAVSGGKPASLGLAYLLWGLGLVGLCGLHRFYLGHRRTGLLWFLTFGLLGIGQLWDVIWIPAMVQQSEARLAGAAARDPARQTATAEPPLEQAGRRLSETASPRLVTLIHNLLAELSVRWLLLLGLFSVVVSSGVLAAGRWEHFSPAAQYGVLLAYTAAFAAGAGWARRQEGLRLTSQTLETLALLLLPVNGWALDGLGIPWRIRSVVLVLLIGISLVAGRWGQATGSLAAGTLVNFLALSGLQVFWSLGPAELRSSIALGILYLGVVGTAVHVHLRSRLSPDGQGVELWLLGAAGSLLILRGLLSEQVQVGQLGLAVAWLGWLLQGSPTSRPWGWGGWVLLPLGWLLAVGGGGADPFSRWQVLAISLLGIHLLIGRLGRQGRLELVLLFLLGLETCWAFWEVLPASWREIVWGRLALWLQPLDFPEGLLGLALLPYQVLWLGLAARWQQRIPSGETGVRQGVAERNGDSAAQWARTVEGLVLGLGGSLLVLSLPHPVIRFWHLFLSSGILAWWLRQKSRVAPPLSPFWIILTHAYGVGALLAGIRWLFPHLSGSGWGAILLLLGLLEWAGQVALAGSDSGVGAWRRSAEHIGLVLVGSSHLTFGIQRLSPSDSPDQVFLGWLWLLVPLVLTAAQLLTLPPLPLAPRWLSIPQVSGSFLLAPSWRQRLPERKALRLPAVVSMVLAQGLTLGRPGFELLGLGLGFLLMATHVWVWAPAPAAAASGFRLAGAEIEAWLTVALGLGLGLLGIRQVFPALAGPEWLVAGAVLLLLLSGCRSSLGRLSPRLRVAYWPALAGWSLLLGFLLLLSLSWPVLRAFQAPTFPGALSIASGITLLALALQLGVEVAFTIPADQDPRRPEPLPAVSRSVMEAFAYGVIWALELWVASSLLGAGVGSPSAQDSVLLLAALNLGLGILLWIGPEKALLQPTEGAWPEQRLQRLQALSVWWVGPLICAGLGWWGSHSRWSELTGLGSLGLAIVLLGLGRRQAFQAAQRETQESLRPPNRKGILGSLGVSLAAYESWLYVLSQQPQGSFGDGLVLFALLGLILAWVYRCCPSWVITALQLKAVWLRQIAHFHWGLASFLLWPALPDLSSWGKLLWLVTGSGLMAYAAWQGKGSQAAAETPVSAREPTIWGYLGAGQGAGLLLGGALLWLPQPVVVRWAGSFLCGLGLVYHSLPWQRWGWRAAPWHHAALVLPFAAAGLSDNSSNLLLVAAYYALLAIWRSQVRLGYLSLFLSSWILVDYSWQQGWSSLTLSALPLVGSLLYVAQVDPGLQGVDARQRRHWLRLVASALLVLVVMIETQGRPWAGFWPVGLGLVLGLVGLALRVRAYLFTGTLGFGLGILRQGWLLVVTYPLLLWGTGILLGLLMIGTAANFERRREAAGSPLALWLGQLQSWE